MRKDLLVLGGIAALLVGGLVVGGKLYSGAKQRESADLVAKAAKTTTAASPTGSPAGPPFVRPHSHALGPENAPVTVVEFLDPECESCRAMSPMVKHLLQLYAGQVRLVVRYMPMHANSVPAASALEAAGEQGKYWEMLESLFANQPQWGDHHAPKPELIPEYAKQLGLDMIAWGKAAADPSQRRKIAQDEADGKSLGVNGTPTFFINGKLLERLGFEPLQAAIDQALAQAKGK
jgi:protein-disulfide isomerase